MVEHSTDAASKAAVRDRIITRIDEFWLQNEIYGPKRTEEVVAQNQDSLKDVDIAVAACTDIALKHNIRPDTLPAPWLEPLPVELYLEQLLGKKCFQPDTGWPEESPFGLLAAPIGLEDIPTQQAQPELLINLAQTGNNQPGNLMIVGVNGSERSSLLRTAILSLSLTHSPAIIEFSMIDYGNQSLKPFQKLPHRTTVLCRGDEVSLSESFRKIVGEIKERNSLFARLRVDNWVSYWSRQDNTSNPRKAIVLVVDNYTSMKSQSDFNDEDFHYIIREGPAYGIFVVVTADRSNDVNYGRLDAQFQILCLSMAKDHLAFSMDDPTYKSWKAVPGRGFRDGKAISRAIEFQAAQPLPASSEKQLDCLLEKVEELANFKGN
jgi:S-DNA-T family DNA segregation ATPase FtsK/SpoIIIE